MLKSFPKILIALFLSVFILQIVCLFFLLAVPVASQAAEIALTSPVTNQALNMQFTPQVAIPGYTFDPKNPGTRNIANLVRAIYNYGIGIIGILAAVVLMYGGVLWIVAGGNSSQVSEAKAYIGAALTGLVLALTSYLILTTVNPALVNLQTTGIDSVTKLITGSCTTIETQICTDNITEENCLKTYAVFKKDKTCLVSCCLLGLKTSAFKDKLWTSCEGSLTQAACDEKANPEREYNANKECTDDTSTGGKKCK